MMDIATPVFLLFEPFDGNRQLFGIVIYVTSGRLLIDPGDLCVVVLGEVARGRSIVHKSRQAETPDGTGMGSFGQVGGAVVF